MIDEDGFESGDLTGFDLNFTEGVGITISATAGGAHHGSYKLTIAGLRLHPDGGDKAAVYNLYQGLGYTDIYAQCAAKVDGYDKDISMGPVIFGPTTAQVRVHVFYDESASKWTIRAKAPVALTNYPESGTSTLSVDTFYIIGVRIYGHATAGIIQVWINGVLKINVTDLDTTPILVAGEKKHVGFMGLAAQAQVADRTIIIDCTFIDSSYIGISRCIPTRHVMVKSL